MNTIVFNKLSSQVLFEEKAKEVEMSSRNYLEVIDGQHPDLLSSSQTIRDNQAIRHRRSGYVELPLAVFNCTCLACVKMWMKWSVGFFCLCCFSDEVCGGFVIRASVVVSPSPSKL